MPQVGFLGIGVELPEQIRRNDWWPAEVVERWREHNQRLLPVVSRLLERGGSPSPELKRALTAMAELAPDPFQGSVERRVAADDVDASVLEIAAARKALDAASIPADQIDALFVYSGVPDFLSTPNAAAVHEGLGLPERCFSLSSDMGCNTFLLQLEAAQHLIGSGAARYALLVQSAVPSRVLPYEQPHSAVFGDGATAVVVGRVRDGFGLLSSRHRVDGSRHRCLVAGVPGKRWCDEGRVVLHLNDPMQAIQMVSQVGERCRQVVSEALEGAGLHPVEVDFYAAHQGMAWIPSVTKLCAGLDHAGSLDTFTSTASLSAANLPLILHTAMKQGLLSDGDRVACFSGGTGETWSASVLRWGGR
jgi:3-oxoacyl-[acyl-carrier-protein] synthase-3